MLSHRDGLLYTWCRQLLVGEIGEPPVPMSVFAEVTLAPRPRSAVSRPVPTSDDAEPSDDLHSRAGSCPWRRSWNESARPDPGFNTTGWPSLNGYRQTNLRHGASVDDLASRRPKACGVPGLRCSPSN